MSMTAAGARRLDIGAVVSDTLAVIQRNISTFGVATAALVGLPALLSAVVRLVTHPTTVTGLFAGPVLIIGLLALVAQLVLQAGLFYAAARDLEGERTDLGELVSVGFKRFLPLIGLIILAAIAIEIGFILLIVPGVMLFLRWCVAGPALAIEGRGVFSAMKRSAELTKGRRWSLFLLWLIVGLLLAILDVALLAMMGGFTGAAALAALQHPTPVLMVVTVVVSPIIGMVFAMATGVFGGVLFSHLRSGREGLAPAAVAEVFA
jgi:hypothetical protein